MQNGFLFRSKFHFIHRQIHAAFWHDLLINKGNLNFTETMLHLVETQLFYLSGYTFFLHMRFVRHKGHKSNKIRIEKANIINRQTICRATGRIHANERKTLSEMSLLKFQCIVSLISAKSFNSDNVLCVYGWMFLNLR